MLLDARHDPTADDMQMIEFLHYNTIPFTAILTKADKLSKMKIKEHIKAIAADIYLGEGNLLATSAETGYGKDAVLQKLTDIIALYYAPEEVEEDGEYAYTLYYIYRRVGKEKFLLKAVNNLSKYRRKSLTKEKKCGRI